MKLKEFSLSERPRERMEKNGAAVLSDAELLAVLFKTGSKGENVVEMSRRLLAEYGVSKLSLCSLQELQKIKGIGLAKACQLVALFEFQKRHAQARRKEKAIKSAKEVYDFARTLFPYTEKECFLVLHLNTKNRVVHHEVVSIGILNASLIHPREVFRSAVKNSAHAVILVHNHPSGNPTPSEEDVQVTEQLVKSGEVLGIPVLDHVIVGDGKWWGWKGESGK